jgi:hypothetical protein
MTRIAADASKFTPEQDPVMEEALALLRRLPEDEREPGRREP